MGGAVAEGLKALRLVLRENPIGLTITYLWLTNYVINKYLITGKYDEDKDIYNNFVRVINFIRGMTFGSIAETVKADGKKVKTNNPENQMLLARLSVYLKKQTQAIASHDLDVW